MELNGFTSDDWAIIQPLVSSLSRLISPSCFWDRLCEKVMKSCCCLKLMRKHVNKLEKFADDIDVSNPVWSPMPSFRFLLCCYPQNCGKRVDTDVIGVRWDYLGDNWISGQSLRVMPCTIPWSDIMSHELPFFLKKSNKAHVSLSRWFHPVGTHFHHDRGSVATSTKGKSLGGPATFWHVFLRGSVKLVKLWNWSN